MTPAEEKDGVIWVLRALEQATCFVFGGDGPDDHWSKRFYFVRVAARREASAKEQREGRFYHSSVWVIRRAPEDSGAWSRRHGGLWLAVAKARDESDPDQVRWTFADGWVECERILREGIHNPTWQEERLWALQAAAGAKGA